MSRKKRKGQSPDNAPSQVAPAPSKMNLFHKTSFHLVFIVLVGLVVYSNTFHVPFMFDDIGRFENNPTLKSLDHFSFSLKGFDYNHRRYVAFLTFALNYLYGGLDVTGYHVVNLLIHIVNGVLVYFLVILTAGTPFFAADTNIHSPPQAAAGAARTATAGVSTRLIAFFTALLFTVHPVQTQAVTYIIQRITSLATMFYLLSLLFYIKGRSGVREVKLFSSRTIGFYVLSLVSAVLAMKTKEITFTLPVVVAIYEFTFFRSSLKKRVMFLIPALTTLVIIPLSVIGTHKSLGEILSDLSDKMRVQTAIPRWDYLVTQMRVIVTYLRLLIVPVDQNLDYDYPVYHSLFTLPVLLSCILLTSLLALAVYLFYRSRFNAPKYLSSPSGRAYYRLISFGIFWFFITLSVESSVIPIADVIFEHRLYLPSFGILLAAVAGIFLLLENTGNRRMRTVFIYALVFLSFVYSAAAYSRNSVWGSRISLWEDTAMKSPDKARVHVNLASFAYEPAGMYDQAIEQYNLALRLGRFNPEAHNNLGINYARKGWFDKAIEEYLLALSQKPDYVNAHYNLGVAYDAKELRDNAMEQYRIVLKHDPYYSSAYANLGSDYFAAGEADKAIEAYKAAVGLKPDFPEVYFNLGIVYMSKGQVDEAIRQYGTALDFKSGDPATHFNLGNAYMAKGLTDNAIEQYKTVISLKPDYADAHNNLGVAYLKKGLKLEARRQIETALKINPDDRQTLELLRIISR
jgi:protein O-mannosyl-transferase